VRGNAVSMIFQDPSGQPEPVSTHRRAARGGARAAPWAQGSGSPKAHAG
jgi:ABC-type dipeptide/oligopeptide/nickel transport system ATPase component